MRVLAWRVLHDEHLLAAPPALDWLIPRLRGDLDRDPLALLLAGLAVTLALAYLLAALAGARRTIRGGLIALAAVALVVGPTVGLVTMGAVTHRPYGQDGGVVQLPLAIEKILAGQSPYGADYSDSILGKEARASDFWEGYGPNPILHHHAYLPGTHLLMAPFYLVSRAAFGAFDPRLLTMLAWLAAGWLAWRLAGGGDPGLAAVALALINPLVYWQQAFGANDMLQVALILLSTLLAAKGRPVLAGATMGLACATKQLAWPYAPFLFAYVSEVRTPGELLRWSTWRRLVRPLAAAAAVFLVVVAPVALRNLRAFWGDIVVYNVGLPGADNYPLGGTPGFGAANFLVALGAVGSLRDYVPFGWFYLLLVPLGVWLLRYSLRERSPGTVLLAGSAALLSSLYFSRVVHPNYLILVAVLLPLGAIMARSRADVAAVPLLLLALAVEMVGAPVLAAAGGGAALPGAAAGLTRDPLGLLISAVLAALALVYLLVGLASRGPKVRLALIAAASVFAVVVPAVVLMGIGRARERRAQDAWVAQIAEAPPGRGSVLEAWSQSFRRDPPARLAVEGPGPPATYTVAYVARGWGGDPRPLTLVAAAILALLVARLLPSEHRPLAVATALLSPAVAISIVAGSPVPLALAALAAVVWLARAERWLVGGMVLGGLLAVVPHALAVVLAGWPSDRRRTRRWIAGLAGGFAILVAPALLHDPGTVWAALRPPLALEPGVGLWNVALYWGAAGTGWISALAWAVGLLVVLAASRVLPLKNTFARAAVLALLTLALAPGASPHELALPLMATVMAALPPALQPSLESSDGNH